MRISLAIEREPEEVTMGLTGQQTQHNSDYVPADTKPGAPKGTWQLKMPPRKVWLWFVLILLANFLLGRLLTPGPEEPVPLVSDLSVADYLECSPKLRHCKPDPAIGSVANVFRACLGRCY